MDTKQMATQSEKEWHVVTFGECEVHAVMEKDGGLKFSKNGHVIVIPADKVFEIILAGANADKRLAAAQAEIRNLLKEYAAQNKR